MASTFKTLYEGQLPNAVATLATVPALTSWIIKHISCVNADVGSAHLMALYRNGTTGAKLMTPPDVSVPAGGMYEFTGTLALEAGGTLAGVTDTGGAITVIVDGDEVS